MKSIIYILLIFIPSLLLSQEGLKVSNGYIKIKHNANLKIKGSNANLTIVNSGNINNQGKIELDGSLLNNTNSNVFNGVVNLAGNSVQEIKGSNISRFEELQINNSSEIGVNILKTIEVSSKLILNDGLINTDNNNFVLFLSGSISESENTNEYNNNAGNSNSFISGPAKKVGNQNFIFPIGKNGLYRPAGISNLTISDTITAEYYDKNPNTVNYLTTEKDEIITLVSENEYWDIKSPLNLNLNIVLSWKNEVSGTISSPSSLVVCHWNGEKWGNIGNIEQNYSDITNGLITSDINNKYSPFTLGTLGNDNTLPINLTSFTLKCTATGSILNWATASEINNNYFSVEKSTDMKNWRLVTTISGEMNSYIEKKYELKDDESHEQTTYYKLSQTDYDGTVVQLDVLSILCSFQNNLLDIIGLNVSENNINLIVKTEGFSDIISEIYDISGKLIVSKTQKPVKGANIIQLETLGISTGMYIAVVIQDGKKVSKKINIG